MPTWKIVCTWCGYRYEQRWEVRPCCCGQCGRRERPSGQTFANRRKPWPGPTIRMVASDDFGEEEAQSCVT